jgi:hypothetical protein
MFCVEPSKQARENDAKKWKEFAADFAEKAQIGIIGENQNRNHRRKWEQMSADRIDWQALSIPDAVMILFFSIYLGGKLQVRVDATWTTRQWRKCWTNCFLTWKDWELKARRFFNSWKKRNASTDKQLAPLSGTSGQCQQRKVARRADKNRSSAGAGASGRRNHAGQEPRAAWGVVTRRFARFYMYVRTKRGGSFGDPAMSNIEQTPESLDL